MTAHERIAGNLNRVRNEIAEAALAGRRSPEEVRLVAVTKAVGPDEIDALVALGQRDLGENRAEQLLSRAARAGAEGAGVRWHMIGHLQRRKVRDLLPEVTLIHGVDSLRLAAEIDKRARAADVPPVAVLLEVNVSGEQEKYGLPPEALEQVARDVAAMSHVDLRGLMTMAPLAGDAEATRPVFRRLREQRDRLNDAGVTATPLAELSMGMSQDYRVAVEEGATMVRIGTALFA
jgi:PLP dependent protein